jgi:2-polyprenyl-3-methyl-5-hydroxy-6-metoxy-1,4-benzoquinol methylase
MIETDPAMIDLDGMATGDPNIRSVTSREEHPEDAASPATIRGDICLGCGGSDRGRLLFHTSRPILQCRNCGLVYAKPRSTVAHDEGPENYSKDYSEAYYRDGTYADYLADRDAIERNAPRVLSELEQLVEGRRLLDVGCATGFFLDAARSRGWTVQGLEVSEYASNYARRELKLPVETGSIVSPPALLSQVDVVSLWDTIEHLDRPDLALANIRRLLKPGGVFVFSTGDYDSLLRHLTGRRWRLFADPTHNFFFNERTLRRMLEHEGFEVLRITRRGKRVSLSLILHQSGLPLSGWARRWLLARGWNPSIYVNLRDVVTVFARRHSSG